MKHKSRKKRWIKEETLMDALTGIPDEMIKETGASLKENPASKTTRRDSAKKIPWKRFAAAACALLVLGTGIYAAVRIIPGSPLFDSLGNHTGTPSRSAAAIPLLQVSMPQTYSFEDYDTQWKIHDENPLDQNFLNSVNTFSYETGSRLLSESEGNLNYSPLSLYYALALATAGADGKTESELLNLLHMDNSENLAAQCANLYRLSYLENEIGTKKLANSLWLDDSLNWKQDFVDQAASDFYASVFSRDLADSATESAMADWVSEQTNNTLTPTISNDPETSLAILNTVYFYDEWLEAFSESKTKEDSFTRADGSTVRCDFMNRTLSSHGFSAGEGFLASSLSLKNGGSMTFILPDEGTSPQELAASPDKLREAFESRNSSCGEVVFQIPKFRFSQKLNLKDTLKELGITAAFGPDADFSKITDDTAILSGVSQETHISINEKGVEAAAFTELAYAGAALPDGRAELILDRPFLYGITSAEGSLLFMGICENPTGE